MLGADLYFREHKEIHRKCHEKWTTEVTSCGKFLGKVSINRGIFQSDSLSPLLFVVCMIPLTKVLRKIKAGYVIKDGNLKVNHLLFMDEIIWKLQKRN